MVRALTHPNSQKTYENAKALEPQIELLTTPEQVRAKLSPSGRAVIGDVALHTKSYYNPAGGWVHASGAVGKLYEEINARGAKIIPNAEMESLILTEDGSDVRGVKCTDGREFYGDKFVMALGSWTGGHPALKDIFPPGLLVPTGQTVAAVQLTKEEYEKYKDTPTISNLDGTGYYSFPVGTRDLASHLSSICLPADLRVAQPRWTHEVCPPLPRLHRRQRHSPHCFGQGGGRVHGEQEGRMDPQAVVRHHAPEVRRDLSQACRE